MAKKRQADVQMQIHLVVVTGSLVVLFLLGLFLGIYISPEGGTSEQMKESGNGAVPAIQARPAPEIIKEYIRADSEAAFATIGVPAVDEQGNGVVTSLDVQVSPGSGKILTNIDKLFFWVDTQNSIRTATKVAQEITKKDLSKFDITYAVRANASVIEGGSAGAALTLVTIAALQNKTLNSSVMITGTITESGGVGPVGEVVAKAVAAKDVGAKLFLAPIGQGSSKVYKPERKCYAEAGINVCETTTSSEKISISRDVGIDVVEVGDIKQAMKYFLGG